MTSEMSASNSTATPHEVGLPFADFGLRLAAGLIDLSLLALAFVLFGAVTAIFGAVAAAAVSVANSIIALGRYGQTVGMVAAGVRVTGEDGRPLGYWHALDRYAWATLSLLIFCPLYIWIAFDPRHQGLHDRLAQTVVWRLERPPVTSVSARRVFVGAFAIALIGTALVFLQVIPGFVERFKELGIRQLPATTLALINTSTFVRTKWPFTWLVASGCLSFLVLVWAGRCPVRRGKALYLMLALLVLGLSASALALVPPYLAGQRAVEILKAGG